MYLRQRHTMRQNRGDMSPRLHCCCDKLLALSFFNEICRTNSNQFEFVRPIAATKFCCSDKDFHMSHEAICCSNLSRRRVVASCVAAFKLKGIHHQVS